MKTFSIITAIAVFFLASVSICEGYMSLNFNLRKRNQRHSLPVSNTNQTPRSVNSRIQQIIPQLQKIFGAGLIATISTSTMANAENDIKGFQTKSGLKYYDLLQGTSGMSPKYGQFVSFNYICYYRSFGADGKLEVVDSSLLSPKGPFLHKHGNGRVIRAIDEGLHTMVPGGRRRIVVPKSIGYTDFGLGPLPLNPQRRRTLGQLLDNVDRDEGELVFDLELLLVTDDENDQGYYDDEPVSQEQLRKLVAENIKGKQSKLLENIEATTPKLK